MSIAVCSVVHSYIIVSRTEKVMYNLDSQGVVIIVVLVVNSHHFYTYSYHTRLRSPCMRRSVSRLKMLYVPGFQERVLYLAAETEAEMVKWVNCLCKLCGLAPNAQGR